MPHLFRALFYKTFGPEAMPASAEMDENTYAQSAIALLRRKEAEAPGAYSELAREMILQTMDEAWTGYLDTFEELRTAYRLMALGRSDPSSVLMAESHKALDRVYEHMLMESMRRVFRCRLTRKQA